MPTFIWFTEPFKIYYGLEACPIKKSQIKSLDFVLNIVFRKILVIKSYDIASEYRIFQMFSVLCTKEKLNFWQNCNTQKT